MRSFSGELLVWFVQGLVAINIVKRAYLEGKGLRKITVAQRVFCVISLFVPIFGHGYFGTTMISLTPEVGYLGSFVAALLGGIVAWQLVRVPKKKGGD